jgi:hypothetical protein
MHHEIFSQPRENYSRYAINLNTKLPFFWTPLCTSKKNSSTVRNSSVWFTNIYSTLSCDSV